MNIYMSTIRITLLFELLFINISCKNQPDHHDLSKRQSKDF